MTNPAAQIKTESEAAAWKSDGTAVSSTRISVPDEGGYQAVIGEYPVKLGLLDDAALERAITAKVYADKIGENGDSYSILGADFIINVPDANALAGTASANIESQFINRAGVQSFLRSGDLSFEQGSKQLVSTVKQGSVSTTFASQAGSLKEGDKFNVTFWVDEDHTATITVTLTISNRTAPVLNVPAYKVVPLGDPFAEGTYADTAPSYMQGVFATDSEDGVIAAINHDSGAPVLDTTREGIYKVTYNVTDSDHNYVARPGAVVVGLDVVPGTDYSIAGKTPIRLNISDVAAANADLRKAASITAWKNDDISPANTTVDPVQLTLTAGAQTIRFAVQAEPATVFDVTFLIEDDRVALTYFGNGATTGSLPATSLYFVGESALVSDQSSLQRPGYTFGGWAFRGNGGAAYQAGDRFNIYEDVNLYAVWNPIPVVTPPTVIVQPPIVYPPVYIPAETTEIAETVTPLDDGTSIPDPPTPGDLKGNWSLISLLLSVLVFAAAAILALIYARRSDDYIDWRLSKRLRRLRIMSAATAILALAPAIVFFVLDDLTGAMVVTNVNTTVVVIAFLVVCVLVAVCLISDILLKRALGIQDDDFQSAQGDYLA
jgi:uncharacterized repeat protein (TIGR02543 family)